MSELAETYGRSRVPLYLQVASALQRRIEDGQWRAGDKISTLEELESEFQVARVTLRQAIDILQKDGLVERRQGKGTFVSRTIEDKRWLQLETTWSALIATIQDNVPRILPVNTPPRPQLVEEDGTPAPAYEYIRSVQSQNKQPYALAGVHLARRVFNLAPDAFRTRAALSVLSELSDIKIARAHQTLVIRTADMVTAKHLEVALNSPTAEAHCVVTDDKGVVIYVGEIIYRGDCVRLNIDLLPNGYA